MMLMSDVRISYTKENLMITRYRMFRGWMLLALGMLLAACNLPAGSQGPTAPPLPATPLAQNPTPLASATASASPTPVPATPVPTTALPSPTAEPCLLTVQQDTTVYDRPSPQAQVFGTLGAGLSVHVTARTADDWYGFEPGVAQAGNVGVFRLRWVPASAGTLQGACEQVPVVASLPPRVCFIFAMTNLIVYRAPSDTASPVGQWQVGDYAPALAHGPDNWILVDLDSGQNPLSGRGWLRTDAAGFNGPCDNLPTVTASPVSGNGGETRIRFAPGAIRWQQTLAAGERRFVFTAAQGQSAEILLTRDGKQVNASLTLRLPDGQPWPPNSAGGPAWRGVLLQSGDYHLEVTAPEGEAGLTLTVTIYPPPRQPQAVTDTRFGFHLVYDGTAFQPKPPPYNATFALRLTPGRYDTHTNLAEAWFLMVFKPSITQAAACWTAPYSVVAQTKPLGAWVVNGVTYQHGRGSEGAMGNFYKAEIFRTFVQGRCATVYFFVHSYDINNFTPGTVQQYNAQAVEDEFKRVFFTLQWP